MKMKKRFSIGLMTIILASLFTACDLSYFDNEIDTFEWNGGVKAPIGHVTYTLSEIFDELDLEELDKDTDGNLSFSYTESVSGGDESDFDVSIDNKTITSSVSTPVTPADIAPLSFPVTLPNPLPAALSGGKSSNNQVVYDLDLSQELTGASFNSGTMVITFTSTFQAANAEITMRIPSFTKKTDGSAYEGTATLNGATNVALPINLNEYDANFTHDGANYDNTINRLVLDLAVSFEFIAGQTLRATDAISYSAALTGAETAVIYGDFKQETFSVSNESINVDFFNDFGDGITFEDASMTITARNGFGFPIGVDLSGITGDTGIGTPSTVLNYTSTDSDELIFNGIENYTTDATSVTTTETLDKTNSNINALLSNAPSRFNINISGKVNPVLAPSNENFYSPINDGLAVDVTIDVPLKVEFTDVKISQEDIEIDFTEDLDDLNEFSLKISTINNIPLSGEIDLIFKENGNDLGLTKSITLFKAAPIDSNGASTGSETSLSTIDFNFSEIAKLKNATEVGLDITFNSGTDAVKLNAEDSIKLIISAAVDIDFTEEENN